MFIFNTTFAVKSIRVDEWRDWINQNYLPDIGAMMITNGVEVFEVMTVDDDDNRTFSVQWRCMAPDHLESISKASANLNREMQTFFGEDCLYFSTILKEYQID